jgi:hypothetical protein
MAGLPMEVVAARSIQSSVVILLVSLLALPPHAMGQQPAPAPTAPTAANPAAVAQTSNPPLLPVESLRILVLQGQGEVHDIHNHVTATPVIEVRDENGRPIEGADVTFELPAVGPGGLFAGQQTTFTTKTNAQGQAAATFQPNVLTGRFNIKVTATAGNRMGHETIRQSNSTHPAKAESEQHGGIFKFAWWKVAVIAGVGATVGVILATRGGQNTVTLIPGTPTFGAP